MNDWTDLQLLRQYAEQRSEAAFAELVRRHIDVVYSAALRMVGNAHFAEDVSQNTFAALAQNAPKLTDRRVLSGWLHRTARNLAVKTIRADARRRVREQEAVAMNDLLSSEPDPAWEQLRPHLDAALDDLSEPDRDALLLRYFERKSAHEIAATLGISDVAAQKRVTRAVERLRALFAERGVAIGASGLAIALSTHATHAAPGGIAAAISTTAALAGPAGSTPATTAKSVAAAAVKKIPAIAIIAASLVLPFWIHQDAQAKLRRQNVIRSHQQDQLAALQTETQKLSSQLARQESVPALDANDGNELLKLRGQVGRLRREIQQLSRPETNAPSSRTEALASMARRYSDQIAQFKQLLEAHASEMIPELQLLSDKDWRDVVNKESFDDEGFLRAASTARAWAENNFVNNTLHPALRRYAKDNGGQFPGDLAQLKAYFESPIDDAILRRWEIVPANELAGYLSRQALEPGEDRLIASKAPVNPVLDLPTVCSLSKVTAFGSRPANEWARVR